MAVRIESIEPVYNEASQIDFGLLLLDQQLVLGQPYEERRRLLTELPMPDSFRVAAVQSYTAAEFV
jgi:hypothetical protein